MMQIVLLPQALTAMLPAIVSQLVVILKDTALGGILIGFVELRRVAGTAASFYRNVRADLHRDRGHLHPAQSRADQLGRVPGEPGPPAARRTGDNPAEPAPAVGPAQAPGLTETAQAARTDRHRLGSSRTTDDGIGPAGCAARRAVVPSGVVVAGRQRAISVALDSRMTVTRT